MIHNSPSSFHKLLLILLIICMISGPGCTISQGKLTNEEKPPQPAPVDAPGEPNGSAVDGKTALAGEQAAPAAGDLGEAEFVEGPFERLPLDLPPLGSASFSVDRSRQISGEALDYGQPLMLQITDGAGLTWTLTIPTLALEKPHTITMTALSDLHSSEIPGDLVGGVLLEPDGLQLDVPALLTVTGEALKGKTLILAGRHDGSAMEFTLSGTGQAGVSAQIYHFSSYAATDWENKIIDNYRKEFISQYKALTREARELLKDKSMKIPVPPRIPMQCAGEEEMQKREQQLQQFMNDFNSPEGELMLKLHTALLGLEMTTGELDTSYLEALSLRLYKKARLLVLAYGVENEYLPAVTRAALHAARTIQLVGAENSQALTAELFQDLTFMYDRAVKELLKELVNEHDYRNMETLMGIARAVALLNTETKTTPEALQDLLEGAMRFELQLTYKLQIAGNQDYHIEARFPVTLQPDEAGWTTLKGAGNGKLISYINHPAPDITLAISGLAVNALLLNFNPCEGTARLLIDNFAPTTESYTISADFTKESSLIKGCWSETFADYKNPPRLSWVDSELMDSYTFPLNIRNRDVEAANDSFDGVAPKSQGKVTGTFEVVLTHTPKKPRQ
jgi:hypothetical protein